MIVVTRNNSGCKIPKVGVKYFLTLISYYSKITNMNQWDTMIDLIRGGKEEIMKRLLITGETVFVSRYIAEYYVTKGYDVYVLNRNTREQSKGVTLIQADTI